MTSFSRIHQLQKEIEQLRSKMVDIATRYGYTSKESIQLSQELDCLLNEYQTIISDSKKGVY
ncbi:aspartyl-phosphate phosphatase Spo0E family protein [Piscibacillus halophilus]|uniref:Stage 0 sporulation regulatory protein n=1 Tax=Piscibacillus halophilus TaxID=571933 RepID=A0A1H9GWI7_9BACI|nr:aspartyl-phosphate phosphatase Spo0E family protein [Piscibacillus halophilus]SEQ54439.1 stage 0 sporulation regulatory protein [Piscibacillus halophilus]